jgi:hypothetical protein
MILFFKTNHFCVAEKVGTQFLGLGDIFKGDLERINRRVIHKIGGNHLIRKGRFQVSCLLGVNLPARDSASGTKLRKFRSIGFVISLNSHKETPRVFNAVGCHPLEDFILKVTLSCRSGVGGNVTPSAMKKTVVSAGGPRIDVGLFYQDTLNTAQGQIPREPGASYSTPNDESLSTQLTPQSRSGRLKSCSMNPENHIYIQT